MSSPTVATARTSPAPAKPKVATAKVSAVSGGSKTKGKADTRTINLKKGTYRVVVLPKYGYSGSTSAEVTIKRWSTVASRAAPGSERGSGHGLRRWSHMPEPPANARVTPNASSDLAE